MKDEYDFSDAERGKFYREGVVFVISVPVELDVYDRLSAVCEARNISPGQLIDQMLRREMATASPCT